MPSSTDMYVTHEELRRVLEAERETREDLAMIVRRLLRALPPDDERRRQALEYLKRKGLAGNVIRAAAIERQEGE